MRVISKFHDYYDSAMGYGHDATQCYIRKTKELKNDRLKDKVLSKIGLHSGLELSFIQKGMMRNAIVMPFVVGFCGKFFRGYNLCQLGSYPSEYLPVYNITELIRSLSEYYSEDEINDMLDACSYYRWSKRTNGSVIDAELSRVIPDSNELFFDLKCPVFVVQATARWSRDVEIVLNPDLSKYMFQRQYEPFQAFQEIDQYLSGVLGNTEADTVNISDEKMRDKKGFDNMSFKKLPTKKR